MSGAFCEVAVRAFRLVGRKLQCGLGKVLGSPRGTFGSWASTQQACLHPVDFAPPQGYMGRELKKSRGLPCGSDGPPEWLFLATSGQAVGPVRTLLPSSLPVRSPPLESSQGRCGSSVHPYQPLKARG